jgi:hypothetical protein
MTDDSFRATRRGFVALAGSVALAGCSGLNPLSEPEPTTIDGSALREAASGDPPTVPPSMPVAVERAYVDTGAEAVRDTLASVPAPFDEREVPNGMIRRELAEMYERATDALEDVSKAPSPAEALGSLRYARESATAVATAWRAIDGDFDSADVRERASAVRSEIDDFRGRWRYVGDDPVRAVLAHAEVEDRVATAGRRLSGAVDRSRRVPGNPAAVGEMAGDVAAARASLAHGVYLYDRFVASLSATRPMGPVFRRAGESLTATMNDRRAGLPAADGSPSSYVGGDAAEAPIGSALVELRDGIGYADRIDDERATGQRANVVLSAFWTLVRIRAFERLRERAESGDYVTVESAADVRRMRESAFRAVESALASDAPPRLARHVLQTVGALTYVAERLQEYEDDDEVHVDWLGRELGRYVSVEAMARATPETTRAVADAIRSAR